MMEAQSDIESFLITVEEEAEAFSHVLIANDAELLKYTELLRAIKTRLKELAEKRLSMTRPLDESKRSIMSLFAPYIEKMEAVEKRIKNAMITYESTVVESRRREQEIADRIAKERELAKKQELIEKANTALQSDRPILAETYARKVSEVHVAPINVAASYRPGVGMRSVWKFRIVDASKLPREYLTPDETKIGGVVRALKGDCQIEGVEVYEDKVVSGRSL